MIDIHCHLQDSRFGEKVDGVIQDAKANGVDLIHSCGTSIEDWCILEGIVKRNPFYVCPSYGIHPWFLPEEEVQWKDKFLSLVKYSKAGVGEIGLDGLKGDIQKQIPIFEYQIQKAFEWDKPITIHCVRAWDTMLAILKNLGPKGPPILFHGFSGDESVIRCLESFTVYYSLGFMFIKRRDIYKKRILEAIPIDRLCFESDSPDGSIVKGKLNEPRFLKNIVLEFEKETHLLKEQLESLSKKNSLKFLKKSDEVSK